MGYALLIVGVLFALSAIVSGPHAFGGGRTSVVGIVIAGALAAAYGVVLLVRGRKAG